MDSEVDFKNNYILAGSINTRKKTPNRMEAKKRVFITVKSKCRKIERLPLTIPLKNMTREIINQK